MIRIGGVGMEGLKKLILRYIFHINWIGITTIAIIALFTFFMGYQWSTFSTFLFYAAFGYIFIGAFSLMGNFGLRQDMAYQYSKTMSTSGQQRAEEDMVTYERSMSFMGIMIGVGTYLIIISYFISKFT